MILIRKALEKKIESFIREYLEVEVNVKTAHKLDHMICLIKLNNLQEIIKNYEKQEENLKNEAGSTNRSYESGTQRARYAFN